MAIGKMLKLGGLENSAPNTSQTSGRFKVAKNVVISKDNYITPRPSMQGFTGNTGHNVAWPITRWTQFTSFTDFETKTKKRLRFGYENQYDNVLFACLLDDSGVVPSYDSLSWATWDNGSAYPNNFSDQSVETQGCKYFLSNPNTVFSKLSRYDGYEATAAGVDDPGFSTYTWGSYSGYSLTGAKSIKVISHFMDLQGNNVTSNAITYKTDGAPVNYWALASGLSQSGTPMLVGMGQYGPSYSYDGINWESNVSWTGSYFPGYTASDTFPTVDNALCQGTPNGSRLWVAIASDSAITEYPVMISEDGINWRRVMDSSLTSKGGGWSSVVWAGDKFVAVRVGGGASAAEKVMTSPDGIVWTYRTAAGNWAWTNLDYNSAGTTVKLVAVNSNGTVNNQIMTSADGITWTMRSSATSNTWRSVAWGGATMNLWVAVGSGGTTAQQIITSPDGIAWTARTSPTAASWSHVAFVNSTAPGSIPMFIAVGGSSIMAATPTSIASWTSFTSPNTNVLTCVASFLPTGASRQLVVAGTSNVSITAPKQLIYATDSTTLLTPSFTTFAELNTPVNTIIKPYGPSDQFYLDTNNSLNYRDDSSLQNAKFYGTAIYNSVTQVYDLSTTVGNGAGIAQTYGMTDFGTWGGCQVIRAIEFIYDGTKYSAIAYKPIIHPTLGFQFEKTIKIYDSTSLTWKSIDGSLIPQSSGLFYAARVFNTVWASPSSSGIYYYKGIIPGCNYSTGGIKPNINFAVNVASTVTENAVQKASSLPFSISGTLNDWYDITSVKINFNALFPWYKDSPERFVAMTIYQDSIVLATQDTLFFSDYTLGGSVEMGSGLSSIKIGDSEYGRITAICGTKDFLIVSREKKVYMVAGTLGTSNLRIQEIPGVAAGAYSNSCLQEVDGNVILMSSTGCWWINAANAKKLSEQIELNFKTFLKRYITQQPSAAADSVIFDMNDYPANAYYEPTAGKYITCAYDSYRNILVFTDNFTAKCGESLVLHLANEEWTNWTSFDTDGFQTTAMTFINGVMSVGTLDTVNNLARTSSEDTSTSVYTYDYTSRSAPKLLTTWMTAGEPSLEKQVLQLKLFGYIWSDLAIRHYQNWDLTTAITDTTYTSPGATSPNNYIMFHKQRLNSSKAMAMAVEMELKSGGKSFWIEGMEVEFEAIQAGMKR